MKKCIILYLVLLSSFLWSQKIKCPNYSYKKDVNLINIKRTDDIFLFDYKEIQYIGPFVKNISLEYVENYRYNKLLHHNYRSENFDALNNEFKKRQYNDLHIFVDTSQTTPLTKTSFDTTKIISAEYNAKIDSLNAGFELTDKIPEIVSYYDGFPVTIYNAEKKERVIGFGNNVALELEGLDKNHQWKKIYGYRRYTCSTGIHYFVLKPQEIATVFEPRLSGNFKTKFRYRLGNVVSNEFEGSINDKYFNN
ncbi:hypothetical protein [Chryseobacterium sp.]|jgi:hypothetical protein|uniref:hypothetical protein n=1 Tax=Chryseobacterium sp. TaxID=1871047 RepID=UPI0028521E63|nr:hypothetical protein [Chryseobacterium sp.]MDR3025881.1 hypothetical protein [Chryseobacterium sp.]